MKNQLNRLVTLLLVTVCSFSVTGQNHDVVKKGQQVPEFSIRQKDGSKISIKDYEGQVVLINFFATWCGPCRKEMPFLQKDVWEKYKDSNNFKLISLGRGHDLDEVTAFKEDQNLGFPIYGDKDKSIYSKFATSYIPRNYVIDADGKIVYASVGFTEEEFDKMVQLLDRLITEGAEN